MQTVMQQLGVPDHGPAVRNSSGSGRRLSYAATAPLKTRDALLYLVLALDWALVWRIQELVPGLSRLKLVFVLLAAAFLAAISASPRGRTVPSPKSPILKALLVLFGLAVLGTPFSLWPGASVTYILYAIIPHLEFVILVAYVIRSSDDLDWLAFWNMVGCAVYCGFVMLRFHVGANGRLGELAYYDSNDFGLMLVCTVPFTVYFMRPGVALARRVAALGSLALILRMLILTGSRGGFVGLIVVMGFLALTFTAVPKRIRIGTILVTVGVFAILGSQRYWAMIQTVLHPTSDYNWVGGDPTGRMEIWKRGIGYMEAHPLLGVGMGAFSVAEGTLSDVSKQFAAEGQGLKWSVAHNTFVEVGAELGVPALLCFLTLLVLAFYALRAPPRNSNPHPDAIPSGAFRQALASALIGYVACGFFVSAEHFAILYLLLGMIMAREHVATQSRLTVRPKAVREPSKTERVIRRQWSPSAS